MKKRWTACFLIFLLAFGLAACGNNAKTSKQKDNQTAKSQQSQSKQSSKPKSPKSTQPQFVWPLTGESANHKVTERPVGVMVENSRPARPQSGLYKADIVYEVLAEGAITRFVAIFQSQHPSIIGPVRSARPYFVKINNSFDGIYVCHGWSSEGKAYIKSTGTDNLNGLFYDGTLFHRMSFRKAPHNSYITFDNIVKGAKELHFKLKANIKPLPFLTKDEVNHLSGEKANKVKINYLNRYSVSYVYQPDKGTYQRYSDGVKSVDRETKTPIAVSNVFIVAAPTHFIDTYGKRAIDLKDGGDALLLQKGVVQRIHWKNVNGRILPVKDGKVIGFVPGQTWVNLIPSSPGISGAVTVTGGNESAN